MELRDQLELDPLSVLLTAELAWSHAFPGNVDEAMRCSRRALAMDPDFALAHYNLAQDYDALGQLDASIEEADLAARLSGRASFTLALLGRVRARRGERAEARAIAAELQERAGRGEVVNHHVAVVLDALDESDAALEWLERACEAREPMLAWLHVVPFGAFENLRKDARFDALLDRIGMARQMRAASSHAAARSEDT